MFITKKIVYFELQKTGGTHVRSILEEMYPAHHTIGRHNTYDSIPKEWFLGDFKSKLKVGNIRNPWDWYVSLWAFACQEHGMYHLARPRPVSMFEFPPTEKSLWLLSRWVSGKLYYKWLDPEIWKKLYADPSNYENFNLWLDLILNGERFEIGEEYKKSKLSKVAGLLTFRYLHLYNYNGAPRHLNTLKKLRDYDCRMNFIDFVIPNENIEEGLFELIGKLNDDKDKLQRILKCRQTKTNASIRESDYRKFYNNESIQLVQKKEQLIIEKYGYQFE